MLLVLVVCWTLLKLLFVFRCSGEYYLGYKKFDLKGVSWYNFLHPECIKEVQSKHRLSKSKWSSQTFSDFKFYCSHTIRERQVMHFITAPSETRRILDVGPHRSTGQRKLGTFSVTRHRLHQPSSKVSLSNLIKSMTQRRHQRPSRKEVKNLKIKRIPKQGSMHKMSVERSIHWEKSSAFSAFLLRF